MTDKETTETGDDSVAFKKAESHGTTVSLLAGFIVVLVIISVLAYKSAIDPKQVQADVESFRQSLQQHYAKHGVDVVLDYAAMEAEGGLFQRTITLETPSLMVSGHGASYEIRSPIAQVLPSDDNYSKFAVHLFSPVTVTYGGSGHEARYMTPEPTVIEFQTDETGQRSYRLTLQSESTLEMNQAGRVHRYDVVLGDASTISGAFSEAVPDDYALSVNLENAHVTRDQHDVILDQFDYALDANADGQRVELKAEGVSGDMIPASLSPIAAEIVQQSRLGESPQDKAIAFETFTVRGAGFDAKVTGDIAVKRQEVLPLVDMQVMVEGADALLRELGKGEYVAPDIFRVIPGALQHVAPQWSELGSTPLEFSIRRSANEPFMIGAIKADELFALVLKDYISHGGLQQQERETPYESAVEPMLNGTLSETDAEPSKGEQAGESQQEEAVPEKLETPASQEQNTVVEAITEDIVEAQEEVPLGTDVETPEVPTSDEVEEIVEEVVDAVEEEAQAVEDAVAPVIEDVQDAIPSEAPVAD